MKLALATWNGRISPVFDVARRVLLVDIVGGHAANRREETLPGSDPAAQANRLVALEPEVLICGAISRAMAGLLAATGIRVVPFTAGATEEVLAAWLAEGLPSPTLRMPGCRGAGCQGCWGHGRGRRAGAGMRRGGPR
jgi:predicted Fe-Mo cluster-binding NifX family protein